jgi:hypothetical protein
VNKLQWDKTVDRLEELINAIEDESVDPAIAFAEIYVRRLWEVCDDSFEAFVEFQFYDGRINVEKALDWAMEGVASGRFGHGL